MYNEKSDGSIVLNPAQTAVYDFPLSCVLSIQLFLECWLLSSLRTFCNFFLKIKLKFSVLMLKSQLNTYFYKSE